MKKLIAFVLVLTLALGLLAGCGDKVVTQDQALKIVAKDLGVSVDDLTSAHVHVASGDVPGYSIYVTVDGHYYDYLVAADGEIVSHSEVEQGHSH